MPANPFDQFDGAGTAPIIAEPPSPQTPAQAQGDVLKNQKTAAEIRTENATATIAENKAKEEADAAQKLELQKSDARDSMDQLIQGVHKARSYINDAQVPVVGNMAGGTAFGVLHHVGGTDAAKLQGTIDQEIRGNIFLKRIADLKAEADSPTGGTGIGRIMQSEIPLFTGALGTLDPYKMGATETLKSLDQIERAALRSKARLNGENPDDPAVQKKYGIPSLPSYDGATPPAAPGSPPPASPSGTTPPSGPSGNPPQDIQAANDQMRTMFHAGASTADILAYGKLHNIYPNPQEIDLARKNRMDVQFVQPQGQTRPPAQAANAGGPYSDEITNRRAVADRIAQENKLGLNQESDAERLTVHGATLGLSDEAAGVGNAAANVVTSPFTGNFDPVGSYKLGRDVERQRIADAQQRLGYGGTALEFAGSLASGNPEAAAGKVVDLASLIKQGARAGGAYGIVGGYGQGEGLSGSLVGAGVGGVSGAAIGAAGGRLLGGKAPTEPPPGAPGASDIATALQTEGIPGARPIADPSVRGKMAYLETTRAGHGPVQSSLAATRQGIADKVAGLTPEGEALTPGGAGEMIQNAGTRTIDNMKTQAGRLYDRAAISAGDTPVAPTNALAALDQHIADLSRNPNTNGGVLDYLKSVRGDLTNGTKTVADLRDLRTNLSGEINRRNLGQSNAERIMGDVTKAAGTDVQRDLGAANPDALSLYQKADSLWSRMSTERQQVLQKLVGPADNPISGEQTMARVRNMMGNKGDLGRFQRTVNMLEPDEQANFRASLFNGIGQKSPEEPFSPAYFLSQTRDMQSGALQTLFGENGARSIQNLRVASKGFTDAQASLNNSRSGFVQNFKNAISSIMSLKSGGAGAIGYAAAGLPGAATAVVGSEIAQHAFTGLSAKALMNADVSSWIRKVATAKTDTQAKVLLAKLNTMAAGNGALQGEIGGLRAAVMKALNDNTPTAGSAAASPDQRPNQQQ